MARPKRLPNLPLPALPENSIKSGYFVYLSDFISTEELAARLFAMNVYPDAATVDAVRKNVEQHCRRGNLPAVRIVPGLPGERSTESRAPWCISRAAAEQWIKAETARAIHKQEAAKKKKT